MACIAIIPARYQSARFAGKPLALLAGRPLIQHVAELCSRVGGVERVIVATDDQRIAAAAEAAGVEATMTPGDLSSGTDRVAWVSRDLDCDHVLNVQGDEPLLDPGELGGALEAFIAGGAEYGTLRAPLTAVRDLLDPHVVKVVVDMTGRALYFSRAPIPFPRDAWQEDGKDPAGGCLTLAPSAEAMPATWQHVGVYMYRRSALARWARIPRSPLERLEGLEQLRILEAGHVIQTYRVAECLPGVDTPADLERVRKRVEGTGSEAICDERN